MEDGWMEITLLRGPAGFRDPRSALPRWEVDIVSPSLFAGPLDGPDLVAEVQAAQHGGPPPPQILVFFSALNLEKLAPICLFATHHGTLVVPHCAAEVKNEGSILSHGGGISMEAKTPVHFDLDTHQDHQIVKADSEFPTTACLMIWS